MNMLRQVKEAPFEVKVELFAALATLILALVTLTLAWVTYQSTLQSQQNDAQLAAAVESLAVLAESARSDMADSNDALFERLRISAVADQRNGAEPEPVTGLETRLNLVDADGFRLFFENPTTLDIKPLCVTVLLPTTDCRVHRDLSLGAGQIEDFYISLLDDCSQDYERLQSAATPIKLTLKKASGDDESCPLG